MITCPLTLGELTYLGGVMAGGHGTVKLLLPCWKGKENEEEPRVPQFPPKTQ